MNPFLRFMKKLSLLFGRGRFLSELEEEMAFHRAQAEKEFVAGGMTPQDAGYAAMRQFGKAAKLREQSHEAVTFRVETAVQRQPVRHRTSDCGRLLWRRMPSPVGRPLVPRAVYSRQAKRAL
jgi:hypothetical protein